MCIDSVPFRGIKDLLWKEATVTNWKHDSCHTPTHARTTCQNLHTNASPFKYKKNFKNNEYSIRYNIQELQWTLLPESTQQLDLGSVFKPWTIRAWVRIPNTTTMCRIFIMCRIHILVYLYMNTRVVIPEYTYGYPWIRVWLYAHTRIDIHILCAYFG